jgi:putative acetyltransferase
LAPLAVIPEYQRQGIGSKLVNEGLRILRSSPCPFVTVLGHPDYYERFGFETVSKHGVRTQWKDVPTEAFMIVIVDESMIDRISGVARYRSEFDDGD